MTQPWVLRGGQLLHWPAWLLVVSSDRDSDSLSYIMNHDTPLRRSSLLQDKVVLLRANIRHQCKLFHDSLVWSTDHFLKSPLFLWLPRFHCLWHHTFAATTMLSFRFHSGIVIFRIWFKDSVSKKRICDEACSLPLVCETSRLSSG